MNSRRFIMWSTGLPTQSACRTLRLPQLGRSPVSCRPGVAVFLYAFDLIELGGEDLRREPLEVRKATLASVLAKAGAGIRFNEHLD